MHLHLMTQFPSRVGYKAARFSTVFPKVGNISTMKVVYFLSFLYFVSAKPQGLPELHIKESKSINGIPSIDITFPDGFQDHLVLERHYMTTMDRMAKKMHCNFIGHLAMDTEACVAVTGCPGDRMEFTINSKHAGRNNRFILHQSGELEKVESAFKVIQYVYDCYKEIIRPFDNQNM